MDTLARLAGRCITVVGLAAWTVWLGWRVTAPLAGLVSVAELMLELAAFAAALAVSVGLWSRRTEDRRPFDTAGRVRATHLADSLGLAPAQRTYGADDTGEVACARRGITMLDPRPAGSGGRARDGGELLSAVFAVEGARRMASVALLVVVLLTGRFPFPMPPAPFLATLVAALLILSFGHWLLSGGALRPGTRALWSMRSVGAGIGDGRSRTGLPIRWSTTMATIIAVNLAMALRGFSDRWTHGLGVLTQDQRTLTMVAAWWTVGLGLLALRTLPQPIAADDHAAHRLEEVSTRRMALGGTFTVAVLGCAAGMLPGAIPA